MYNLILKNAMTAGCSYK